MKRNKIAAGALALALGLGAVAPSFAADTKVSAEYTYDYKEAKKEFIEKWNALRTAEKNLETAKANEAVAKKAYEDALAKLAKLEARYGETAGDYTDSEYQKELDRVESEKLAAILKYENNTLTLAQKPNYDVLTEKDLDKLSQYIDKSVDNPHQEAQAEALKDIIALNARLAVLKDELKGVEDKRADLQAEVSRRLGDWNEAKNKTQEAKNAVEKLTNDAKTGKYDEAKKALIDEGASVDVINKAEKAGDITLIFEEVTPAKPDKDDEISAETRAELEKAIADSKVQIEAVKFLKENTPKTIEKVADKLDKLVKEANATIKLSEELLGKKSALNFVSTAYAAEEKSKEERAKELRDKLNANTQEIKDTLKENEASLVEEENKDNEKETPAPAPEKEDDKKEDDKKEDSKEDDKKEDDKKEDSKEDDKKEDKKVEKTTKVVKKAGKNAKTGIAGVAGVAGVLAAASVAYAASKKNN